MSLISAQDKCGPPASDHEFITPSLISTQDKCGPPAKPCCSPYSPASMSNYKNTSPAKKLRGIKRLLTFLQDKSHSKSSDVQNSQSVCQQQTISISRTNPQPKLIATLQSTTDIPPIVREKPKLHVVKPNQPR